MKLRLKVPPELTGERVDVFLARTLRLSRCEAGAVIKDGRVAVDGRTPRKGAVLLGGEEIAVEENGAGTAEPLPADTEATLRIVYEDAALVVVDKPALMPSHPVRPGGTGTVANALVARFPEMRRCGGKPIEAGLVHRLDNETSGLLAAAQTRQAFDTLSADFRAGRVEKRYIALVWGNPGGRGTIAAPIAAHPRSGKRVKVCGRAVEAERLKARPAETRFRLIEEIGAFSLLELEMKGGIRHQARALLHHIGHPIVRDKVYRISFPAGLIPAGRHFLHASFLGFAHPVTGERLSLSSGLPEDLAGLLISLRSDKRSEIS